MAEIMKVPKQQVQISKVEAGSVIVVGQVVGIADRTSADKMSKGLIKSISKAVSSTLGSCQVLNAASSKTPTSTASGFQPVPASADRGSSQASSLTERIKVSQTLKCTQLDDWTSFTSLGCLT